MSNVKIHIAYILLMPETFQLPISCDLSFFYSVNILFSWNIFYISLKVLVKNSSNKSRRYFIRKFFHIFSM